MKISLKKNEVIKRIQKNGYCHLENAFTNNEIKSVRKSLFLMLDYILPNTKIKDLHEKYYSVKNHSMALKGHFFDMTSLELNTLKLLHDKKIIDIVKSYFKTKVVFSGRPAVHIHDSENERFLDPHQETNQCARDFLFIWAPLFDATGDQGGLMIYENSHMNGYYQHNSDNKLGSSHLRKNILSKFKKKKIEVKAGSALLIHSALIHGSVETKKKKFARFILSDRYCPLAKIPYLKKENTTLKIPHYGVNYNSISD